LRGEYTTRALKRDGWWKIRYSRYSVVKKTFLASTKTFVFTWRAYFIYVLISLCEREREVVCVRWWNILARWERVWPINIAHSHNARGANWKISCAHGTGGNSNQFAVYICYLLYQQKRLIIRLSKQLDVRPWDTDIFRTFGSAAILGTPEWKHYFLTP
jgi:hypothetical protein